MPLSPCFPSTRMRRLRCSKTMRDLVRETRLHASDLIYPIFIEESIDAPTPIASMPGVSRQTERSAGSVLAEARREGLRAAILFGVSHHKDGTGSDSMKPGGLLSRMVERAKDAAPDMLIIADLCFCEYTDHGHCGPLDARGNVDNDATLDNLRRQAVVAAEAGADVLAPSGMMDGMVAAIRGALDESGFEHIPVLSYASKFASGFYGPFREAAGCSLGKGSDRKTYQLDPANARQALREAALDETEGADMLMVKPGLPYLDILARLRATTDLPLCVYQVSGEYAMIKFAAQAGAIDERAAMTESLLAFRRAGADMIVSYYAREAIKLID
ncbi:MAG: porphobilinogen synthase [Alphaproteobacteria bacterium]|nr:porphobilinogen synthase [Alphaproteobacteria bacterium]